jgi:DNA-binding CsgD family transcriptional regulator
LESTVQKLSGQLYEAALDASLVPLALENIAKALGCFSFHQLVFEADNYSVKAGWTGLSVPDAVQAAYEKHYVTLDARPLQAIHAGLGSVFDSNEVLSAKQVSRSELFQDFLIPNGVSHCLGGHTHSGHDSRVVVAFLSHADRPEFDSQQRHLMSELMPHFQKSAALMFQSQSVKAALGREKMLLNLIDAGAITLSTKLVPIDMNMRAQALLAKGSHLQTVGGQLVAKGGQGVQFSLSLMKVQRTGIPESLSIFPDDGGAPAHITISRVPSESAAPLIRQASLLVLVTQPEHQRIATVLQLMQLFGFSPAEARLARAMAHGKELDQYALEQGVKMSTVRTQSSVVYAKAKVRRQAELVRLLLSIPSVR